MGHIKIEKLTTEVKTLVAHSLPPLSVEVVLGPGMEESNAREILLFLQDCSNLRSLSLQCWTLYSEDIAGLVAQLMIKSSLEHMAISLIGDTGLTERIVTLWSEPLRQSQALQSITIDSASFAYVDLAPWGGALSENASLREFHLNHFLSPHEYDDQCHQRVLKNSAALLTAVMSAANALAVLSLRNLPFRSEKDLRSFMGMLEQKTSLRQLMLEDCASVPEYMNVLLTSLGRAKQLHRLQFSMHRNDKHLARLNPLLALLAEPTDLQHLQLNMKMVDDAFVAEMVNCLVGQDTPGFYQHKGLRSARLTHLDLSRGEIGKGNKGMAALGRLLAEYDSLQSLDLGFSYVIEDEHSLIFSDAAMRAFLAGLAKNQSLRVLHLNHCYISSPSLRSLLQTVAQHPSLQRINLSGMRFDVEDIPCLIEALQRPKALRVIDLSSHNLSEEQELRVAQALIANTPLTELKGLAVFGEAAVLLQATLAHNREKWRQSLGDDEANGDTLSCSNGHSM
ncbi:MAG: hypothetical protein JJT82_07480 [Legionellaceae bacterium]|nr:hypothetical protein [Legionellaceae bacterium]